jgi:hypothetical protein
MKVVAGFVSEDFRAQKLKWKIRTDETLDKIEMTSFFNEDGKDLKATAGNESLDRHSPLHHKFTVATRIT